MSRRLERKAADRSLQTYFYFRKKPRKKAG